MADRWEQFSQYLCLSLSQELGRMVTSPRQTSTSVTVDAPREGRPKSRISWLLRQLNDAPADLTIEANYPYAARSVPASLTKAREDPGCLLYAPDPKREARSFQLTSTHAMGSKRGRAEGSFVRETSRQTVAFYRDLVQNLKPWQPRAPKLHESEPVREDEPGVEVTIDGVDEEQRPIAPIWSDEQTVEQMPAFAGTEVDPPIDAAG